MNVLSGALHRPLLPLLLLAAACASAPQVTAPDWQTVPDGVAHALCSRLQMDAIATGAGLAIVTETQPIVTPSSISSLASSARGRLAPAQMTAAIQEANRAMPVAIGGGPCGWVPLTAAQRASRSDEMVVEISAPMVTPMTPPETGLFARASVGPVEEWYWVALARRGDLWGVRSVRPISR